MSSAANPENLPMHNTGIELSDLKVDHIYFFKFICGILLGPLYVE